ncbi:fungal specific transcription factor [Fusarium albosuccineum]|uniref:Fungal specific transcription factor n=1 Tax=Fusarium albosuccineum TaxID=1237068 RepID=A0A8H4LAC7_9HYPO|nr:fungal specific transcription factor [Fusarium albosuccineum]
MWSHQDQDDESERRSAIACQSCRRDRQLPYCQICVDNGQSCNYPAGPLKPGPKIGSVQRPRRRCKTQSRAKATERQPSRKSVSPSPQDTSAIEADPYGESDVEQILEPESQSNGHSTVRKPSLPTLTIDHDQGVCRRNSQLNIHDLSFILHPSHQASTPEKDQGEAADAAPVERENTFQKACCSLGFSEAAMINMIEIYFDNMVAINIFHEPSFQEGLRNIASVVQLSALLAAITGYAIRFLPFENGGQAHKELQLGQIEQKTPDHFINMALQFIDQALTECNDEPPSLCILQALIMVTHCQLTQGVLGRAWRSLGMCVRLAYELNFHLLDSKYTHKLDAGDVQRWCEDEAKRRAWWAIWEMDVFASTIRRTPTAVNWTQMEVLLPVPDPYWHRMAPMRSCFFEQDPAQRWKSLHESGNQSPKAWFIVINSLMKDGQVISCPRGVPNNHPHQPSEDVRGYQHDEIEESRQKLETLANAVHCFVKVLPDHLRYRQQYLGFQARIPGQVESHRQLHCSIYNIYVMTQLARLMIYRYDVFGSQTQYSPSKTSWTQANRAFAAFQDQEAPALGQYFEAADNILTIVNRSCENHIQYINPYLSSTIWLAAAVQLVRKQLGGPSTKTALIKTRFDLLYLTYKQCVSFWDTKTAMQQNLESLEVQLEGYRAGEPRPMKDHDARLRRQKQRGTPGTPGLGRSSHRRASGSDRRDDVEMLTTGIQTRPEAHFPWSTTTPSRILPDTPPASDLGEKLADPKSPREQRMSTETGQDQQTALVNSSMLDFMEMPGDVDQEIDMDPFITMNMNATWKNFELPSDIHDLLSGYSTY